MQIGPTRMQLAQAGFGSGAFTSRMFTNQDAARVLVFTIKDAKYDSAFKALQLKMISASLDEEGAPEPALCVIDLTNTEAAVLAGWDVDVNLQIGSMSKIAALFAACQLRDDLIALKISSSRKMRIRDVLPALVRAWSRSLSPVVRELSRTSEAQLPQIERMFDLTAFEREASGPPDFTSADPMELLNGTYSAAHYLRVQGIVESIPKVPSQPRPPEPTATPAEQAVYKRKKDAFDKAKAMLVSWYDEKAIKQKFDDLLLMMTMWSSNEMASVCISLLGLPYIKGALLQSGLYDDRSKQGLWLGSGFTPLFESKKVRPIGIDGRPVTRYTLKQSTQVGTARQCALLFASLMRNELFVHSNAQMRLLLKYSRPVRETGFIPPLFPRFDTGWRDDPAFVLLLDKVGILESVFSESAFFLLRGPQTPQVPGREYAYAIAALNATEEMLEILGADVRAIIARLNP